MLAHSAFETEWLIQYSTASRSILMTESARTTPNSMGISTQLKEESQDVAAYELHLAPQISQWHEPVHILCLLQSTRLSQVNKFLQCSHRSLGYNCSTRAWADSV